MTAAHRAPGHARLVRPWRNLRPQYKALYLFYALALAFPFVGVGSDIFAGHLHNRDIEMLGATVLYLAARFGPEMCALCWALRPTARTVATHAGYLTSAGRPVRPRMQETP